MLKSYSRYGPDVAAVAAGEDAKLAELKKNVVPMECWSTTRKFGVSQEKWTGS